jgi:NADPH:quinone reductase-like Zn-dependent oxidoreductase
MDKMRAVVVDHNAPGHLALQEVDRPLPKPTEALVKVAATSLNFGEVHMAQGAPAGSQVGWDIAGTVEQAAEDGLGPLKGARIIGLVTNGAWAEFASVPTDTLAEIPDNISFSQAATLPMAGLTALYSVERGGNLLDRKVLVTGASGGVGHFACQLAKLSGAEVIGLIRREAYKEKVIELGADKVVISDNASNAKDSGPYRLIVDGVGGQVLANALSMLGPDGICVSYGAASSPDITFNLWPLIGAKRASLYGLQMRSEFSREPCSIGLMRLAHLVSRKQLRPYIFLEAPVDRISEVVADFLARKIAGKAVIRIG